MANKVTKPDQSQNIKLAYSLEVEMKLLKSCKTLKDLIIFYSVNFFFTTARSRPETPKTPSSTDAHTHTPTLINVVTNKSSVGSSEEKFCKTNEELHN